MPKVLKYKKVADTETGEVSMLVTEVTVYQSSRKTFTKVFHDKYEVVKEMKAPELEIYIFIVYNLKMFSKKITLHHSLFNFGKQKYYKAITGLTQKNVIAKVMDQKTGQTENNKYHVNSDFVFNGKI